MERAAVANNSIGKRLFFFGNVVDVDNFPFDNFPGQEDLDLNSNGTQDEAGRDEAAQQLNEARQLDAAHPDTRFYSAVLLQRRGQRAAAIRAYRRLLRDVPDHEGAARQLRALGR